MDDIKKIIRLGISDEAKVKYLLNQSKEMHSDIIKLLIDEGEEYETLLSLFMESGSGSGLPAKRPIPIASGNNWDDEQLQYFSIEFNDTNDINDICKQCDLNDDAKTFLEDNKDIDGPIHIENGITDCITTAFKGYLLFLQHSTSIESCVDDAIRELLQRTLGKAFLIKTRYDMSLTMCNGNTKATADVLAIFIPKLYMGVIVVEDKPHDTSKSKNQQSKAEAQLVAEAIAIVQQKRWPIDKPVFMIRVLETKITFYKAHFTDEFVRSVRTGTRRYKPFLITRHEHRDPFFPDDRPGYDLLKKDEREIIVRTISSIGQYITNAFAE